MEYVFTPWKNRLLEDLQAARHEVVLISPFIKTSIAREIYRVLAEKDVHVRTVSRFSKSEFLSGASDIDAHFMLADISERSKPKYELRSLSNVHAKIFVIDWRVAYVGSSNLTFSGLLRNYEGTVRLTDEREILPLKERFVDLWKGLRPVCTKHFIDMLYVLSNSKVQRRNEESEHFYDIKQPIVTEGEGDNASAVLDIVSEKSIWIPAANAHPPTLGNLITEEFVTSEATSNNARDTATDDQEGKNTIISKAAFATESPKTEPVLEVDPSTAARKSRLEQHAIIIRRFLGILSNRFNLNSNAAATHYARVIKTTQSVNVLWSDDIMGNEQFSPVDPRILYAEDKDGLESTGSAVYGACMAQIAIKLGIVERFGYGFANAFIAKAHEPSLMSSLWHQNLLGPLLTLRCTSTSAEQKPVQRATGTALKRLLAVVYLEEGLPRVLELVEEFFNPADLLGTDIMSLADFEGEKTTLQNVATMAIGRIPEYVPKESTDNTIWVCSVKVGNTIAADGKGGSLSEASKAAAAAALDVMASHRTWSKTLLEYRINQYKKAMKRHHPLLPNASLDQSTREKVRSVFALKYGVSIQPSLGYAACIDQETRRALGLCYSNSTMAWFGSYLIQILLQRTRSGKATVLTSSFWQQLAFELDIENLRKDLGIQQVLIDVQWQGPEIGQALATAIYFSNPFPIFSNMFTAIVKKIMDLKQGENRDLPLSREGINRLVKNYDASTSYTTVLQELTQSKTKLLPNYEMTKLDYSGGPGAENTVEMTAVWSAFTVRALGRSKVVAKNKCAFELLRKLLGETEFWEPPSDTKVFPLQEIPTARLRIEAKDS